MNTNTNNAIVLNQDSAAEEYAKILRGRYVTDITLTDMDDEGYALTATLTLDNDTTLTVEANEGCGGCANGWYHITRAFYREQMRPHHERPRRIHAQRKRHQGRVGKIHHLRHDRRQRNPTAPPHRTRRRRPRRIRHRLHAHRPPQHEHVTDITTAWG